MYVNIAQEIMCWRGFPAISPKQHTTIVAVVHYLKKKGMTTYNQHVFFSDGASVTCDLSPLLAFIPAHLLTCAPLYPTPCGNLPSLWPLIPLGASACRMICIHITSLGNKTERVGWGLKRCAFACHPCTRAMSAYLIGGVTSVNTPAHTTRRRRLQYASVVRSALSSPSVPPLSPYSA